MELTVEFVSPPGPCNYLPDQIWQFENAFVQSMTAAEYQVRMEQGWRRFGRLIFRPNCAHCTACRSLRVDVAAFRPNRSQRRNRRQNFGVVQLTIGPPRVDAVALELYDRYHEAQSALKGWPEHAPRDAATYYESFADHPFPTEEWRYRIGERVVGIGYVDRLPSALSAIYFFSDPDKRDRALGTWNVLSIIDRAAELHIPFVYMGYHIAEYASLAYKANFGPNQIRHPDGTWRDFRP
jgi:arginine-tRNA-protein transferase